MMDKTEKHGITGPTRQFSLATLLSLILAAGIFSAYLAQHQRIRRLELQVEELRLERAQLATLAEARLTLERRQIELLQRFGPSIRWCKTFGNS